MSASLVLAGLVASKFILKGDLSSAKVSLTAPESVLNKKDITIDETENNVDCFNVEKVNLSKKLENDVTIKTDPDLNKKAINKGDVKFSKEELDSKELAKRLIISIFSFASIGVATSFIKHLVDSKNEQQNKKEDDPIPGPNQEDDPIPGPNQEDDPGNNFLKIVIYTVFSVILICLFVKFVIEPLYVFRVYDNEGLNLLTKLKVRPKKVEFIINENEIDEEGNPPDFIIDAAKKKLISPGDEVIIKNKDLVPKCANKILDNCDDIIFFVDPEAKNLDYTGVLKVVSVSELIKYYIDMASNSDINSSDGLKDFSEEVSNFFYFYVFRGSNITKNIVGIRTLIDVIIQPSTGALINMTWTRNERETCENALRFLEQEGMKIKIDYLKSRIDATKLYRSILLKAGFGIGENDKLFAPNGKVNPGGVEVFQMLTYMEKLLNGNNWKEIGLQAYKSLLIEFYYYSIFNPDSIKDKNNKNNTEWDKGVFEKLKELKGIGENLNKEGLLEKIRNLKGFLLEINSEIKADELNNKVYGSILQNNN